MTDNPWILKVLSGTHVGAEVVLSSDETVLGKDEDCDLVIDDVSLSGKHISLYSEGPGTYLTLLDTDKPVYIDGEEPAEKSTLLKPFQVITIGTLFLAVGPANKDWPTIDLLLENKMGAVPAEEEDKSGDGDDSGESGQDDSATATDAQGQEATDASASKYRRWVYLLIGGLPLAVVFSVVAVFLLPTGEQHDPEHKILTPEKIYQITSLAKEYEVKIHVDRSRTSEELSTITGYTDTEFHLKRFLERLQELDIHGKIEINSSEKAINAISALLDQFRRHNEDSEVKVSAVPGSPGDLVLEGYVKDQEEWLSLVTKLKRDIQGYNQIKDEVQSLQGRMAVLQTMLNNAQLGEEIKILETQKGLALSGQLDQQQKQRLARVKKAFTREFGLQPPVVWDVKSGANTGSSVKLDIRAVSFGEHPHIIMKNGDRYTIGAQLDNGYTIAGITTISIVLKKDGKTELFYLNPAAQ